MPNAREFTTVWGFKIEHEKLDRVESQLEAIKHRLEFLAAAEIAHKLFELTERFARFAEELHLAAASTGATVEEFQKLSFSAQQAGVSQEELAMSMARVSKSLYAARNGSEEAQKAFAQAGFSPEQIAGLKNSQQALLLLGDKLKGINDPIKRLALTQELLGRGSARMVGFLAQGSAALKAQGVEAEQLGIILSEHQVEALIKVEHALQKFWALMKNIGSTIAADVAPNLEYAINDFLKFFQTNRAIIELNFKNWIFDVAYALGSLWAVIKFAVTGLIELAKYFHLEGEILPLIGSIGSAILAMFAIVKVTNAVSAAFGAMNTIIKAAQLAWTALGVAEWFAEAPMLAIVGVIAILIIAVDQLWAALTGKQSLLGTFVGWITDLKAVQGIIGKVSSFLPGVGAAGAGAGASAGGGPPGSLAGGAIGGGNNYSIDAPIQINVPEGTDPAAVGKHAREGVRDHMNRVLRETQRSTTSAIAY